MGLIGHAPKGLPKVPKLLLLLLMLMLVRGLVKHVLLVVRLRVLLLCG